MSSWWKCGFKPNWFNFETASWPRSTSLAVKYTLPTNCSHKPFTISKPMPLLPPVTCDRIQFSFIYNKNLTKTSYDCYFFS